MWTPAQEGKGSGILSIHFIVGDTTTIVWYVPHLSESLGPGCVHNFNFPDLQVKIYMWFVQFYKKHMELHDVLSSMSGPW